MIEADSILLDFLSSLTGRFFLVDWLFIFFSEVTIYIILTVFLLYAFRIKNWKDRWSTLSLGVISVILSRGIATPLFRFFFDKPRPFQALDIESLVTSASTSSFPSGHIAFIVPLAITLWYINKKAGIWSFVGVTLMGISRVVAGVHWPTDILGGVLIGVVAFVVTQMLLKKLPDGAKAAKKIKNAPVGAHE